MNKLWLSLCLFFCIYNLKLLIDDCYLINYRIVEENNPLYNNETNFLLCSEFSDIRNNNNLSEIITNHLVDTKTFLNYSILSIETKLEIKNYFNLSKSIIFMKKVCFLIDKEKLENDKNINKFMANYEIFFFIYSKGKLPFPFEYISRKKDQNNFIRFKIQKEKVYTRNYLDLDCNNAEDQLKLDLFNCINNCFKRINKSDISFYYSNDEGLFDLNLIFKNDINKSNYSTINYEIYKPCLKECKDKNCFLENYTVIKIRKYYWDNNKDKIRDQFDLNFIIFEPYYSTAYFSMQFIGLLTLFTNTNVITTIPFLLNRLAYKYKFSYNKYFGKYYRKFYPKFKFTLIVFSLIFFVTQIILIYDDYKFKSDNPNKATVLRIKYEEESFSLIICLPLILSKYDDQKIKNYTNSIDKFYNHSEIFHNCTFDDIEEQSNSLLNEKINSLNVYYGDRNMQYDWKSYLSNKVFFKYSKFNGTILFARCFMINFKIKNLRYRNLIPSFILRINFTTKYYLIYLINRNNKFTDNLYNFDGEFRIERVINIKYSNCKNYSAIEGLNCFNRQHCIDRCKNELFFKKYSKFTIFSVIDKNQFHKFQLKFVKFDDQIKDKDIELYCSNKFIESDCSSILFKPSLEVIYNSTFDKSIYLFLDFQKLITRDIEQSFGKLILNVLNLESILLGTNATKLLLTLFCSLIKIFKLKWHKIYRIIIFLICFCGFLYHNYLIMVDIIQLELIDNAYFEKIQNVKLPNLIYCFNINFLSKIDHNHELNGLYLNKITNNLEIDDVFLRDKIQCFNKNKFKNCSDNEIIYNTFYFLNYKCFEIQLNLNLNVEDFYFQSSSRILGIYFNKSLYDNYDNLNFCFRQPNSKQLSSFTNYQIGKIRNVFYKYQITLELFKVKRDDKFELLKNLKSLFYKKINLNDAEIYLNETNDKFKELLNLTTKEILLENEEMNLKIDDEMFEQYYFQIQDVNDHYYPTSENYEKEYYHFYAQNNFLNNKDLADFYYDLSFLAKQIEITNDDNYNKLIQSFLNTLSLWLDICILDMAKYVYAIFYPFYYLFEFFLYFKNYLKSTIESID